MAILTIENLPDDLMTQLQQLASQNNQTINAQIVNLLKQVVQKPQPPLKFLISPETEDYLTVPNSFARIGKDEQPFTMCY